MWGISGAQSTGREQGQVGLKEDLRPDHGRALNRRQGVLDFSLSISTHKFNFYPGIVSKLRKWSGCEARGRVRIGASWNSQTPSKAVNDASTTASYCNSGM